METEQLPPLGNTEIQKRIKNQILQEAKDKPWSNSWKYITAKVMLQQGRDVSFVSDVLGVSYRWLLSTSLIKWVDIRDKNGILITKVLRRA